jgi:hypothetical protein
MPPESTVAQLVYVVYVLTSIVISWKQAAQPFHITGPRATLLPEGLGNPPPS